MSVITFTAVGPELEKAMHGTVFEWTVLIHVIISIKLIHFFVQNVYTFASNFTQKQLATYGFILYSASVRH